MALKDVLSHIVMPNKEALKKALRDAVDTKRHHDVGVIAYCILDHTGFDKFLDRAGEGMRSQACDVLTQFLANSDNGGAKQFLDSLVDAVAEELQGKASSKAGTSR